MIFNKNKFYKPETIQRYSKRIERLTKESFIQFLTLNIIILITQLVYIYIRYPFINSEIPFYYSQPWGEPQLTTKGHLLIIPLITSILIPLGFFLFYIAKKYYLLKAQKLVLITLTIANIINTVALIRIIYIATINFTPIIPSIYKNLFVLFSVSFILLLIFTPYFIKLFISKGLITSPQTDHPGMVLRHAVTRGGGFVFSIFVFIISVFLVKPTGFFPGIYLGAILISVLGLLDDMQNTGVSTKLKFIESPILRFALLSVIILIVIPFGIRIDFVNNPFNGIIFFNEIFLIQLGAVQIPVIAVAITVLWVMWVMTVLSWSNGVDGQFGGIVGITFIVLAILALRFEVLSANNINLAILCVISAGVTFGITKFNWYPSKIIWGFGAYAAGFIIATSSILIGAKIAVATVIMIVPFMDAFVLIIKRLIAGKNPMKGDKGHLHHLLMQRGWGVRRIATFYWFTTAIFGILGIVSANKDSWLLVLTISGFVAFFILAINVSKSLFDLNKR